MPKLIDKLFYELEVRTKDWTGGLADAEKSAQKFTTYIAKHPVAAVGAFTAALVALGAKATQMAADLENSLAKTASIIGRTANEMADFRKGVLDIFARIPVDSLDDLTQGLYDLVSAGVPAEHAMEDLEVAAKLAVGGVTTTSIAVDGLTSVLNAYADTNVTAQHAADAFFVSAKIGKATIADLSQEIGTVAPLADALGVSLDDLLANVTALTLKGIKTDEAFTAIRATLTSILKPASEFSQKFPELAQEFDRTRLKSEGLTRFLSELAEATKGNDEATTLLFGNVRALNGVMALTAAGGKSVRDILDQITHSSVETTKAFNAIASDEVNLEKLTRNQLNVALQQLGAELLPATTRAIKDFLTTLSFVDAPLRSRLFTSGIAELDRLSSALDTLTGPERQEALKRFNQALHDVLLTGGLGTGDRLTQESLAPLTTEQLDTLRKALVRFRDETTRSKGELEYLDRQLMAIDLALASRPAATPAANAARTANPAAAAPARPRITLSGPGVVDVAHQLASAAPTLDAVRAQFDQLSGSIELADAKAAAFGGIVRQAGAAALPTLDLLISRTEDQVKATKAGTKEHDAAVKLLEEELRLRAEIADKAKDTKNSDQSDTDAHAQRVEQLRETGREIQTAATGAIQLAQAFGLVDQNAAQALNSITQIAANLGAAAAGDVTSIVGVVGGIAGLISSIGGDSPAARAHREAIAANTQALERNTRELGDLAHAQQSGSTIAAAKSAAAAAAPIVDTLARLLPGGQVSGIYELFQRAGLSKADVDALAQTLGITLDGTAKAWQQFLTAIQSADVSSVADKYGDALQHLKESFEVNDITDPVEQLRQTIALLSRSDTGIPALANALGGLDVGTTQGRAAAIQRLQQLFNDLASGRIGAASLGGASIEQANQEILDLINQLRGLDQAGGPAGTGGFSIDRSITEVTGSRLAGLLTTGNVYAKLTAQHTAIIAQALTGVALPVPAIAPPPLPSSTSGPGGITITIQTLTIPITLPAGVTPADGTAIGTGTGTAAAQALVDELNRSLGDRFRQTQRVRGQVVLS